MLTKSGVVAPPDVYDEDGTPVGIAIAVGAVAVLVAAMAASRFSVADPAIRLAVMAVGVAVYAAWSRDLIAVAAVATLAWFVQDGFLIDRYGVLDWRGWDDVARMALLLAAAGVGLLAGKGIERERRHA